ncbi:MAG: GNAT family N-acetyltransferase [Burkholderiales bacterium]|nr:GNAT family N-acetyltransferase [Burkholderiales bacterium]
MISTFNKVFSQHNNLKYHEAKTSNDPVVTLEIQPARAPTYQLLRGNYIILDKLKMSDIAPLYQLTHGSLELEKVWEYLPYGPFENIESMQVHYQKYINTKDKLVFCVKDRKTNAPIGIVCLSECKPEMGNIEIASVTYPIKYQKSEANTEAVYLLITYCINQLDFRKIVWRCNNNNLESKKAAIRLGFEFEGLFYKHMIVKGKNRDTAWYGIIDTKWRFLEKNYQIWLSEPNPKNRRSLYEMNSHVDRYSKL